MVATEVAVLGREAAKVEGAAVAASQQGAAVGTMAEAAAVAEMAAAGMVAAGLAAEAVAVDKRGDSTVVAAAVGVVVLPGRVEAATAQVPQRHIRLLVEQLPQLRRRVNRRATHLKWSSAC